MGKQNQRMQRADEHSTRQGWRSRLSTTFALSLVIIVSFAGCASTSSAPTAPQTPSTAHENPAKTETDAPIMSEGRAWTARFYGRETQALWDQFTPRMQTFMKSKNDLDKFHEGVASQLGKESKIIDEHIEHEGKTAIYRRTVVFAQSPQPFSVVIGFDPTGHIGAFGVLPAEKEHEAPTTHLDYVTRTPLRLPFKGEWTVFWGGRTIAQNRHAAVQNQRFAYDFEVTRNGSPEKGDGKTNADYWCYGEPIFAPGAGKIVIAIDGIEDNVPGTTNRAQLTGNHVVIDHGQNEFSFLAHLQKGSVRVKAGDQVEAGTPIGACGNSGNTSQPHLHYHLQNSPEFAKGEGLPAPFRDYTADGKHVGAGEPIRNQRISNGHPKTN